jgi:hypothetical protein
MLKLRRDIHGAETGCHHRRYGLPTPNRNTLSSNPDTSWHCCIKRSNHLTCSIRPPRSRATNLGCPVCDDFHVPRCLLLHFAAWRGHPSPQCNRTSVRLTGFEQQRQCTYHYSTDSVDALHGRPNYLSLPVYQNASLFKPCYEPRLCKAGRARCAVLLACHKRGQQRSPGVAPDHGWPQIKAWVRTPL